MAKKTASGESVEYTPRDIARALDGISDWIRGVRSLVLKLDNKATVKLGKHALGAAAPSLPMLDGCPPAKHHPSNPPHRPHKKK